MKLKFQQSGGFAPIILSCQFDTQANPGAEAEELERLVERSGLGTFTGVQAKGARDVYYYTFEIDMNGKSHKVTFDQLSVPKSLEQLLEFLKARATRQ